MRKFLAMAALAATAGMALVACGDDDDEAQAAAFDLVQPASGTPTLSGPTSLKAGTVAITFKNTGQAPADLQLVSVEGDHSAEEVQAVVNNDEEDSTIPDWITAEGGVGTVAPGQSQTATHALGSGKYYAVGTVETEDEEADGPLVPPVAFEVTGSGKGSLPKADATVTAKEYSFEVEDLKAGSHTLKFDNAGEQLHHIIAAPMVDGATLEQVQAFFESEEARPPPLDFEAGLGTAVIDKDRALVTTFDFKPGKWAFICFMTDRAGGAPHAMQGMLQEVNIAS